MSLTIHFLNVGHGDCTIIKFESGRLAVVDINTSSKFLEDERKTLLKELGYADLDITLADYKGLTLSGFDRFERLLDDPAAFLKRNYDGERIFRFVLTHPDMDHMSGIFRLLNQCKVPVDNFWDIENSKTMDKADFEDSPYEYADWVQYQALRLGADRDNQVKVLKLLRGAQNKYYQEDGIHILAPTEELAQIAEDTGNYNIGSYVLLIEHGACKIILGADAEEPTWKDIYLNYSSEFLRCDLLKASHHGRRSGYFQPAIKDILPKYTIVSVGKKPETDASHLYGQYSTVFSTRYYGTITAKCWKDGDIWLYDCNGSRIN